ncbi:MAG: DoxX family protein [Jiangellales bacterium]
MAPTGDVPRRRLSEPAFTSIGALEVLGAIGVVLPWALDIAPVLTPVAAAGLAVITAGAALTQVRRGERQPVVANVILLALALTVAIGRGVELAG